MATVFFPLHHLMAPLQALADWLFAKPAPTPVRVRACPDAAASAVRPTARPSRVVRVVRVFEGPRVPASAGRMVISGRMADVCAELDRLAALESRCDRP
jgi:hypothetical protein